MGTGKSKVGGVRGMTQRTTITIIALATLTLAGFVIVSSLVGSRPSTPPANNAAARITPTIRPQATLPPQTTGPKTTQTDAQIYAGLGRAQSILDQLNDAVRVGDWQSAQNRYTEFEQATQHLPTPQLTHPDFSLVMQDFFALYKVQLVRALAEQNTHQSRFAANQLFGIISEQRARFGSRGVPIEFQRLAYLIREIDIWKQSEDVDMVWLRSMALQETWKEVRPAILARRNGPDIARVFDDLTDKLLLPERPQDYGALLSELNKEFELMNNLFQRPTPSSSASPSGSKQAGDDD
jgi:hypothetical protein